MIVKVIVREKDCSVWNKEGDRLYFSEDMKDVDFARNLVAEHKTNHFNAMWRNKIVAIQKPARGYTW